MSGLRVGHGYDVHRLGEDHDLVLCGVKIDYHLGLIGHSDADVAIHALIDALLGASVMGDIGRHFPDTDDRYKNVSSLSLLSNVSSMIRTEGFSIVNCDITVAAQEPKLAPHIEKMRENLADALNSSVYRVSVKATTTERLGVIGRSEAMAAWAVVLIERSANI